SSHRSAHAAVEEGGARGGQSLDLRRHLRASSNAAYRRSAGVDHAGEYDHDIEVHAGGIAANGRRARATGPRSSAALSRAGFAGKMERGGKRAGSDRGGGKAVVGAPGG